MTGQPITLRDWALLILRVGIGFTFIVHGSPKLFPSGPAGFAGFLQNLNFPAPLLLAWIVALVEFVGGIAMVVGFLVRWVGVLQVIEMTITSTWVKMRGGVGFIGAKGTGWELDALLLCIAAALTLVGAGALSLDALRSRRPS